MLRTAKSLEKSKVIAQDGPIGHLRDLYFEDDEWKVRYLVIEMGGWLGGRAVLISPFAATAGGEDGRELILDLTQEQIRHSPPTASDKPVSRQHEEDLYRYYGWAPYWSAYSPLGLGTTLADFSPPIFAASAPFATDPSGSPQGPLEAEAGGDPHLRSMRDMQGYRIEADDGDLGHAEDFVVDDRTWDVRFLLVDTKNWWPGKKVAVSSKQIGGVRWADAAVSVALSRSAIKDSPEYSSGAVFEAEYVSRLDNYYAEQSAARARRSEVH